MATANPFQEVYWQRFIASDLAQCIRLPDASSAPLVSEISLFSSGFQLLHEAASDIAQGKNNEEMWSARLQVLMNSAHGRMRDARSPSELASSRAVYLDSCILRGLAKSILSEPLTAISTLDHAIIIAGAAGEQLNMVLAIIHKIQSSLPKISILSKGVSPDAQSIPIVPPTLQDTIPCPQPPSLLGFQSTFSRAPFILRDYACDWPALTDHAWKSVEYLRSVAGPGRVVPVEIGRDYRSADWEQDLVSWDKFLSALDFEDQASTRTSEKLLYMAQHDLTRQFPALRDDIVVPDYVYASLTPTDFPSYMPPNNDEQIILNTWLGPEGTMSPAHIDPFYNCYVQIVGSKSVWLAPPSVSSSMYPCVDSSDAKIRLPSSALGNTSEVDVFAEPHRLKNYPKFIQSAIPASMTTTLCPGDMLFFPPGWWHAMRSETTSFSISIWF